MAIVRCEKCGIDMKRTKKKYHETPFRPIGYPDTGVICGLIGCHNPGLVWLEETQYNEYLKGERIFNMMTCTAKVKII